MNQLHGETCSNILHLADLVFTLPASTAVCERGFSHLKRTKTDFRSKLGASALRDSLLTTLHTPGVEEFDPLPVAQPWASGAHRRPTYKRKATSSSASTSAIDDIEEEAQEVEDDEEEEEEEEDSEERAYLNKLLDQCTHDDFFDIWFSLILKTLFLFHFQKVMLWVCMIPLCAKRASFSLRC